MIELSKIRIDGGTQARAELNNDTVSEYAEIIRQGGDFPPITLFNDGRHLWLADGFHRFFAYKSAGAIEIPADIKMGTKREAILHAVGANAKHGLRRTNADKRSAVMMLLNDKEWAAWTDVAIAKACGVSSNFVGDMRRIINPINDSPVRTVERNGTTYQQNTANIGKKPEKSDEPTDDDILAEALGDESDVLDTLQADKARLERENEELAERLAAATKGDVQAELDEQIKKRFAFESQAQSHMHQAAVLDKELRYLGRILAELRKLLKVEKNSELLGAAKKLMGQA